MTATTIRKETSATTEPEGAPWVTLFRAARMLNESRETVSKRALRGEIRVWSPAHLVLFSAEDVQRVLLEKQASASDTSSAV